MAEHSNNYHERPMLGLGLATTSDRKIAPLPRRRAQQPQPASAAPATPSTPFSSLSFSFSGLALDEGPVRLSLRAARSDNRGRDESEADDDSDAHYNYGETSVSEPAEDAPKADDDDDDNDSANVQDDHVKVEGSDKLLEDMFLSVQVRQDDEIRTSPLLTVPPLLSARPSHFGLLGVDSRAITKAKTGGPGDGPSLASSQVFHNVAAPSSTFICGSQGSGKSNTLACLLENCLLPKSYGVLPHPLTGLVFHYDGFNSDAGGLFCEAACLASDPRVRVRVLCAPTNIKTIQKTYSKVPNVIIEPLQLQDSHLNTSRMLDLMAVGETNVPLYMRVVSRVLRDLRLEQQRSGGTFNYERFKWMMKREDLTEMQAAPLKQRLETLESFMLRPTKTAAHDQKTLPGVGNGWTPKAGQLTIVDLSCPCVTAEMACSLFNICLQLFVEGKQSVGRIVALDEAHKYMTASPESRTLTDNLLGIIRLQRHLGARIVISTQEPTVSPKLLDLCSVTIVHRFTSPDWLRTLQGHLAGVSYMAVTSGEPGGGGSSDDAAAFEGAVKPLALGGKNAVMDLFAMIVSLRTGEALVFSPSAIIDLRERPASDGLGSNDADTAIIRLAHRALRIQVRTRLTQDGGRSVMAV